MGKRAQDEAPKRSADAQAWIDENLGDQEKRYAAIAKEMEDLAPTRAGWYQDFLQII